MPLEYDDIPGSWGEYSKGWPSTSDHAYEKCVFANKSKLIPYGSYVLMESGSKQPYLRVENTELLEKLNENFDIVRQAILRSEKSLS